MEKKKFNWREIGIEKLAVIFLCGLFLLVLSWPSASQEKKEADLQSEGRAEGGTEASATGGTEEYARALEKRLKTMLSKLEGVNGVEVMITLKNTGEKVTLKDTPYSQETTTETDETGETTRNQFTGEETTVLLETEQGTQPYVIKEKEPQIEGVLVLVRGLENAAVKIEISEAVEALFDVPSHKIKVMKMDTE